MNMNKEGHLRQLIEGCLLPVFSTIFVILLLYQAQSLFLARAQFTILFIFFALIISILNFINNPDNSFFSIIKGKRLTVLGFLLIIISVLTTFYLAFNFNDLSWRAGDNTNTDFIFASLLLIPILLMTWKRGGGVLIILVLFALFYMFFGPVFPGSLKHGGFCLKELLTVQVLSLADSGLLCAATQIVATWVTIFIVYAGLAQGFGVFDCILKCSFLLCRKNLTLVPQVPILTSLFFGSISGAAAANVGATGSFTIPLMKRYNLPAKLAGGIEAVASTGGQIMPPVMGATAFLIAMMLGKSYVEVMLRGFIPAILFYGVFAFAVHIATKGSIRDPISGSKRDSGLLSEYEYTITKKDIFQLIPLFISAGVILLDLIHFRMEVFQAALHGIIAFLITQLLYEMFLSRKVNVFWDFGKKFIRGSINGASTAANVGVMVAGMALILKTLTATALAPKISYMMLDVAGNSLIGLLLLLWVVCLIFGLAVSTLIVYLLVIVLAAPALKTLGVSLIVSHFVVFYFSAVAMITPPTAPASLVASGIAGENFIKTSFAAMRIGMPLFILPFAFVTYPELIEVGSKTLFSMVLVAIGFIGISYALNDSETQWKNMLIRAFFLAGGGFISFHPFFYEKGMALAWFIAAAIVVFLGKNFIVKRLQIIRRIIYDIIHC